MILKIRQDMQAEMARAMCSGVSFFMNKFRKLGFLDYNGSVHVHRSFLIIVLHGLSPYSR